jgi:MinD-like ATPase involved in chromosome partitioning or flagellar assembly
VLVSLVSVKGSPGVTTAAAALAAVGAEQRGAAGWRQGLDLVELDPSGGEIEALTGVTGESGLLRAATGLRPESLAEFAVEAPAGVRSVLAPMSPPEATSTLMAAVDEWGAVLSTVGGLVVADAGRWERAHPAAGRLAGSDVVVLVCRPDAQSAEHARHVVAEVRAMSRPAPLLLVTVGVRPYGCGEVAGVLGVNPAGSLAWDPAGVTALWAEGVGGRRFRRWPSSALARSAREVLGAVARPLEEVAVE